MKKRGLLLLVMHFSLVPVDHNGWLSLLYITKLPSSCNISFSAPLVLVLSEEDMIFFAVDLSLLSITSLPSLLKYNASISGPEVSLHQIG